MKKYILLISLCTPMFFSCKKNGDGTSNTIMMSETYRDGILEEKYTWDSDQKLVRVNQYSIAGNQSDLFLYKTYEYNAAGYIEHQKIFAPNDTLNNRYVLSFDNQGRLARVDWIWPGNTFNNYRTYDYDQQNRVIKITEKKAVTNANLGYSDYAYDEKGLLKYFARYTWSTDKWVKDYEYDYITAGNNVYGKWQEFMITPIDLRVQELSMASRSYRNYSADGAITTQWKDSCTAKEYNSNGLLTKQRVTRVHTKPVKPSEVWDMTYSYKEL